MNVLMIQPRFEDAVVSGRKPHSIRPPRSDGRPRARVGEPLSIRVWTGKPYRSQQREVARAVVTSVHEIEISDEAIWIWNWRSKSPFRVSLPDGGCRTLLDYAESSRFARRDGFADAGELKDWFAATHGLPFTGALIRWRLDGIGSAAASPSPGRAFARGCSN